MDLYLIKVPRVLFEKIGITEDQEHLDNKIGNPIDMAVDIKAIKAALKRRSRNLADVEFSEQCYECGY